MSRSCILFATISMLFCTTAHSTVNRYMTHYDLTRDGKVDNRELRTVAYMNHKLPSTISNDIFRKADRNGDKFIDRIEIIAAAKLVQRHVARATLRWLEDHDTDGDGLLNEAELFESIYMELGLSKRDVSGCFQESDINKDRYLSSSELIETLHCSRLLALKEAKELLKIYDTDGDHRLNIQEAQMLADLRYGIEPSYATIVFKDASHQADHTINELELIDFLTKLREKAAITALNKRSSLDQNGDEAVSFSELVQGYEKQLKKSLLKKIFNKVDINKNAYIDPVEYVSLQNLIADEILLQTVQNEYSAAKNAATSLPALIIFSPSKKPHNQQPPRQRRRRSDLEADIKLTVSDKSHPGIRELIASNASSVHFSTVVTAVPKFMELNEKYQKFLSNESKLISKIFANSERSENRDVIETNNIKKIRGNSISDENISPVIPPIMQRDRKLTSTVKEGQLESHSRTNENGHVRNQNGMLNNSPNVVYIKKFEKFFDFLGEAIKKISQTVKENEEKQEGLKSLLRSINITKHSSPIASNISSTEANETEKIVSVSENPISISRTTEKLKNQGNLDNMIYGKNRNEENLVVHTPIDDSEYKTVALKNFSELFDVPFLQLDEGESETEIKMINIEENEHEHSFDERNFHDAVEKNEKKSEDMDEDGCILEGQTDSSDEDDSSEQPAGSVKLYKCNMETQTTNGINIKPLQEIPKKFKKVELFSEFDEESKDHKKRRQKLQNKSLNKTDSLEYEVTLPVLEDKSSSVSYKVYSEYDNDDAIEMTPDTDSDEESDESFNERTTKRTNFNESSEHESTNRHKFTHQSLHSRFTDEHEKPFHHGSDSMKFEKISVKAKGQKLSQKPVTLEGEKSINTFELPIHTLVVDKKSKEYKIPEPNSMFSIEENVTNKYDQKMHPQSQTTDSELSKSQNSPSEQSQLQVINPESQTLPNSSKEEFFDEVLDDMINATLSEIHQPSMISEAAKSKNHKEKDFQKTTKRLLKLKKNDAVSQIPEISVTSTLLSKTSSTPVTLPSSSKISSSTKTNPKLSTTMDHSNDEIAATETFLLTDYEKEQISEAHANSRAIVEIESDKINQTSLTSNTAPNSVTHLENENDTHDVKMKNTKVSSNFTSNIKRDGKNGPNKDNNISAEITAPTTNTTLIKIMQLKSELIVNSNLLIYIFTAPTFRNVIYSKKKLLNECLLKKKYRSKLCSNNQRSLSRSIETSGNINMSEQNFSQKNDTKSLHQSSKLDETSQLQLEDWHKENAEDLLLRAVQEYQLYLNNQEKRIQV
ncbi:unnamed protein product [Cercopithifilaria johnstoni]|uniref:EF-hand domain-containing protein n=1 Tax=Cercopithifilaria johnstoni TaxID=2874296 RepID=A0A8J2M6U0_9BILA|nr:unnamed protein product [Cercopithifilaria johnstoni]